MKQLLAVAAAEGPAEKPDREGTRPVRGAPVA